VNNVAQFAQVLIPGLKTENSPIPAKSSAWANQDSWSLTLAEEELANDLGERVGRKKDNDY